MSNYSKTTNFTAKDALASGDPNKVVKGSEHDTEYDNIATSSATKMDKVAAATDNNIVTMDSAGNAKDSTIATDGINTITSNLVGDVTGDITGNADTATTWATGRTITLTGEVTGVSAAFDGSGNLSFATVVADDQIDMANLAPVAAGDQYVFWDDTQYKPTTNFPTYAKRFECTVPYDGTFRIRFTLEGTHYGRIYKNGSAVGTERAESVGPTTYSEDLAFVAGDLLQIYNHASSDGVGASDFLTGIKISCDEAREFAKGYSNNAQQWDSGE